MGISFYDATVPSWLQMLGSLRALIGLAQEHCAQKGIAEDELLRKHFAQDMLPLAWQFRWASTYSSVAVEGLRSGEMYADMSEPPATYDGLRDQIDESIARLNAITVAEMDQLAERNVRFLIPSFNVELPFTAINFIFSFVLPNFYFHATTAYDLLRDAGLPIGKLNFMGKLRHGAVAS